MKQLSAIEKLDNVPIRLNVTEYCNLACRWCSKDGMWGIEKGSYLDESLLAGFLEMMKSLGFHNEVLVSGGEPTIHPRFQNLAYTIKESGLKARMNTNGIVMHPYYNDVFKELRISLHSVDPASWGAITQKGTKNFYKIIDHLTSGCYSNRGHSVLSVITPGINDTEHEIEELFTFCKEYGFGAILLQQVPYAHKDDYPLLLDDEFFKSRDIYLRPKATPLWRGSRKYNVNKLYDYEGLEVKVQTNPCYDNVCEQCYDWHFIQITPQWEVQSCMLDTMRFPIKSAIEMRDLEKLEHIIAETRKYNMEHTHLPKIFTRWFDIKPPLTHYKEDVMKRS